MFIFPQLLVEPGTKRFKSFNDKPTHGPAYHSRPSWSPDVYKHTSMDKLNIQPVRDYTVLPMNVTSADKCNGPLRVFPGASVISVALQGIGKRPSFPMLFSIDCELDWFYSTALLQSSGFTSTGNCSTTVNYWCGEAEPVELAVKPCQSWTGLWWHECVCFWRL